MTSLSVSRASAFQLHLDAFQHFTFHPSPQMRIASIQRVKRILNNALDVIASIARRGRRRVGRLIQTSQDSFKTKVIQIRTSLAGSDVHRVLRRANVDVVDRD
jgi:hypothetical protein